MNRIRSFILVCLIALELMLPSLSMAETARGFDTPEACATALYESIVKQDVAAMDECIAFPEMAEQFDFAKYAERIGAITIYTTLQPATTAANIAYNEYLLKSRWYMKLVNTLMLINNPAYNTYISGGSTIDDQSEDYQKAMDIYYSSTNLNGFADVTMTGLADAASIPQAGQIYSSEKNQENIRKQLACWGVTNFRELAIQLLWNIRAMPGNSIKMLYPLQLIEINGRWLANPNASNLATIMGVSPYSLITQYPEDN